MNSNSSSDNEYEELSDVKRFNIKKSKKEDYDYLKVCLPPKLINMKAGFKKNKIGEASTSNVEDMYHRSVSSGYYSDLPQEIGILDDVDLLYHTPKEKDKQYRDDHLEISNQNLKSAKIEDDEINIDLDNNMHLLEINRPDISTMMMLSNTNVETEIDKKCYININPNVNTHLESNLSYFDNTKLLEPSASSNHVTNIVLPLVSKFDNLTTDTDKSIQPNLKLDISDTTTRYSNYFCDTDRIGGHRMLDNLSKGSFIIRPSSLYYCSLVLKGSHKIYNIPVCSQNCELYLDVEDSAHKIMFPNIDQLINYYCKNYVNLKEQLCLIVNESSLHYDRLGKW